MTYQLIKSCRVILQGSFDFTISKISSFKSSKLTASAFTARSNIKVASAILNCILARQLCFEDPSCSAILEIIPRVCGPIPDLWLITYEIALGYFGQYDEEGPSTASISDRKLASLELSNKYQDSSFLLQFKNLLGYFLKVSFHLYRWHTCLKTFDDNSPNTFYILKSDVVTLAQHVAHKSLHWSSNATVPYDDDMISLLVLAQRPVLI
uniref:Uncharacterized protein n=1 Tax=Glossina pallidipes TaxID=7398 RepID=A0A1B0A242_GLOPL